jgi:hypothetical protein
MFSFPPNSVADMIGPKCILAAAPALLAGLLVVPGGAAAQCRLCASPETGRAADSAEAPIRLEVATRLDFDQLILVDSRTSGTARLNPDGSGSTSGALGALGGRAMVGSVVIRGEPGRLVRIGFPASITLHGRLGGTLELTDIASDLPAAPRLDPRGELQFRFGGELRVEGDAGGDYRGDVPVTVEYL